MTALKNGNMTARRTVAEMLAERLAENNVKLLFEACSEAYNNGDMGKFNELFPVYAEKFKKVHGYRPHWAR